MKQLLAASATAHPLCRVTTTRKTGDALWIPTSLPQRRSAKLPKLIISDERLELEALRRQAAQDAAPDTSGMIACTFPEPAPPQKFTPPPNIYLSVKDGQLLTLIRGQWTALPSTYDDVQLEVSGPFVARTVSASDIAIETARLRINRQTAVAELQPSQNSGASTGAPTFPGKCAVVAAP